MENGNWKEIRVCGFWVRSSRKEGEAVGDVVGRP